MIPEAFAETHDWAGFIAVLGFLVSFTLTELAGREAPRNRAQTDRATSKRSR
jgi:hypothetical protein